MTKSKYVMNGGKRPKVDLGDVKAVEKMRLRNLQKHIDDLREERAEINNVIAMTLERIRERPNEVKIKAERIYGTTYRKDGPSLSLGGTHASPVRHEVAGHYRTRNGKTFWVRGHKRGIDGPKKVRLT